MNNQNYSDEVVKFELQKYHKQPIYCSTWSENNNLIVTAGMDQSVKILPVNYDDNGNIEYRIQDSMSLQGHEGTIRTVNSLSIAYFFLIIF